MTRRRTLLSTLAISALLSTTAACSGGSTEVEVAAAPATSASTSASTTPSPSPSADTPPTPTAAEVIASGRLSAPAAAVGEAELGLAQQCSTAADDATVCRSAWTIPSAKTSGLLPGRLSWTASASAGRFVLTEAGGRRSLVIDPSGTTQQVRTVRTPLPAAALADAVPVSGSRGYDLVDPTTATRAPVDRPAGVRRWQSVTSDGRGGLWAFAYGDGTPGPMDVWHTADGSTWVRDRIDLPPKDTAFPAYLAAHDDHAAALAGYDGATLLPVAALAVTPDGGRTWATLGADDVPFTFVDSLVAAPDGSLYVLGETDRRGAVTALFRSADDSWTTFEKVRLPGDATPTSVTALEDGVAVGLDDGYLEVGADGSAGPVRHFPR